MADRRYREYHIFKRNAGMSAFKEVKLQEPIKIDPARESGMDAIEQYIEKHVSASPDGTQIMALEGGDGKYGQRYAATATIQNRIVPTPIEDRATKKGKG